jgi:hypothetical protein
MPEELPAPTDEQRALSSIAALIKHYEPHFDLQRSFTPGVLGCSDPRYPAIRSKWLDDLDRKRITPKGLLIDDLRADLELSWQESEPADSRFNWRVTVRHGDYFIHIMAVDKNFERFAFSLQKEGDLEAGLTSDIPRPRPFSYQYKVVDHLSELKPILDDLYASFKQQDERRRIDKAVAEEREKWVERLAEEAKEKENRRLIIYAVAFIAVLVVVNEYFHGVPGDVVSTAVGAGIGAFIGALLYFWGLVWVIEKFGLLDEAGKATPRTTRITMTSSGIVFFALWAALAYAAFRELI